MKRILIVVGVVLIILAAAVGGYLYGIAHTVAVFEARQVQPKGEAIPINWCAMCWEVYPEWYCWLGGCRR